jgi:hypothetical protein
MGEWLELDTGKGRDRAVTDRLTATFTGEDRLRGLGWEDMPGIIRPAVAWVHMPTGNLVLVESHASKEPEHSVVEERAGFVAAQLWIAATGMIVPLRLEKFESSEEVRRYQLLSSSSQDAIDRISKFVADTFHLPMPTHLAEIARDRSEDS